MSDGLEKETIKRLTSVVNVLKNPFQLVDEVLAELGSFQTSRIRVDVSEKPSPTIKKPKRGSSGQKRRSQPIRKKSGVKGNRSRGMLSDLASMVQSCRTCGRGAFQDELIDGMCESCIKQMSMVSTGVDEGLAKRLKTLEAQIEEMKSKNANQGRISLNDIRREILATIRKDLRFEIQSVAKGMNANNHPPSQGISGVPPPPPPPQANSVNIASNLDEIDFSSMNLVDLANFTPEFLDSLSLTQRNQFRDRLRELQQLERMTPKQRKEYHEHKKREAEEQAKFSDLQDTLKNLEELANPLFMKMKEQAEGSTLSGKGTLGRLDDVNVYILCHNCKNTNEVQEGKDQPVCAFCGTSLEMR
ncbi:MAG: hypothetical protein ACFFE8_00705 [Candidatus Heimdallarchaeota archaeon]